MHAKSHLYVMTAIAGLALIALVVARFLGSTRFTPPRLDRADNATGSQESGLAPAPSAARSLEMRIPSEVERASMGGETSGPDSFFGRIFVRELRPGDGVDVAFPCRLFLFCDSDGAQRVVEAPDGTWCGPLLRGKTFSILGVENDELVPELEQADRLSESAPYAKVVVRRPTTWRLHALDARTRAELERVSVYAALDQVHDPQELFNANPFEVPEDRVQMLAADVTSPIEVPESVSTGFFWVSSPGYAPRAFLRNRFQRRGRVELQPAGSLILNVSSETMDRLAKARGGDPDAIAFLLLSSEEESNPRLKRQVDVAGRTVFEDLPAGAYSIAGVLERGRSLGVELFGQSFEVLAGRCAVLDVDPEWERPNLNWTESRLTIVLPRVAVDPLKWRARILRHEADDSSCVLDERLSEWTAGDEGLAYTRHLELVLEGQYEILIEPTNHRFSFDLRGSEDDVLIDLSDTSVVEVEIRGLSEQVRDLSIAWGYTDGPSPCLSSRCELRPSTDGSARAKLFCQPRPIRVQLVGAEIGSEPLDVVPVAGQCRSVELSVASAGLALLRVSVWEGGGHALTDSDFWSGLRVDALGHGGHLLEIRYGKHGTSAAYGQSVIAPDWAQAVLVLSRPGRYRVVFPSDSRCFEVEAERGMKDHFLVLD